MTGRRFLFTMTTGRSGTATLAKLLAANLPAAECHHEILGWDRFGVDTPDVSQMTLFNSQGNVPQVREFWRRKFDRIRATQAPVYAETSHVLMKAGLLENIGQLSDAGAVHLVALERDLLETLISFRNRYDFTNKSMWWLWYLDPDYPNKIVDSRQLLELGINGVCLWYLLEVRTRAAYYRQRLAGEAGLHFHRLGLPDLGDRSKVATLLKTLGAAVEPKALIIPEAQNRGMNRARFEPGELDTLSQIIGKLNFDPEDMARRYIAAGRRLAD